jgi:molybdenum cofactor cytidylyltransferase
MKKQRRSKKPASRWQTAVSTRRQHRNHVPDVQVPDSEVAAIVLAAGASRRLGQPKQLVLLEGEPLLRRIVRLALEAGCSPVVVVLGAIDEPCRQALATLPPVLLPALRIVVNPDWAEGMSTSLRAGCAALSAAHPPESTLILVTDQFRLTAGSLAQLLRAHAQSTAPVTAALYSGRLGVPAIFRRQLLPALASLFGDQGARHLLAAWANQATAVPLPEAADEVDTPEDLASLQ